MATTTISTCATCGSMRDKLDTQDARITELENHILSLETDLPMVNKKRRLDSVGTTEEQDKKDIEIQRLKEENIMLRSKAKENKPQVTEPKQNLQEMQGEYKDKREEDKSDQLIQMIEKKLTHGLNTIQSNMEKLINAKLDQKVGKKNCATSELENTTTID